MYDRTQTGWIVTTVIGLLTLIPIGTGLFIASDDPSSAMVSIACGILFFIFIPLFYQLRIRIDSAGIHIIYGVGIIRKTINPEYIDKIEIVQTPWYWGKGIRLTPRGVLYNIEGNKAVLIKYFEKKTKKILIGSDDCEGLKKAIENKYIRNKYKM